MGTTIYPKNIPNDPTVRATPLFISTSRVWNFVVYPPGMASLPDFSKVLLKTSNNISTTTQKKISPSSLRTRSTTNFLQKLTILNPPSIKLLLYIVNQWCFIAQGQNQSHISSFWEYLRLIQVIRQVDHISVTTYPSAQNNFSYQREVI